jgi:sigma-B regulation protein RsbU (phosphoserine phosphatase)
VDEAEVAIAREIQAAFLPQTCRGCEGVSTAARRRTSGSVGGDFHDFIATPGGPYSVIIGDVSGHGLHSALGMALVLGAIRALGSGSISPQPVMQRINDVLCRVNDRLNEHLVLCSMFFGIVDPAREVMRFCNAGHPEPLIWTRDGERLTMPATGPPLGVVPGLDGEAETLSLGNVRRAVFYTDGVTEARSTSGAFLGDDRVRSVLEQTSRLAVEQQADALMDVVARHVGTDQPVNDDVTVIVADFTSERSEKRRREPEALTADSRRITG